MTPFEDERREACARLDDARLNHLREALWYLMKARHHTNAYVSGASDERRRSMALSITRMRLAMEEIERLLYKTEHKEENNL